jgi:hypothetical protein
LATIALDPAVTIQIPMLDKSRNYWIFTRWLFFVIALIIWIIGGSVVFYEACAQKNIFPGLIYLILPFGCYVLFSYFNLCAFPLRYSSLGTRKRSPSPEQQYKFVLDSRVQVGRMRAPELLVKWFFYDAGFEIKVLMIGSFFIPWESIISIEKDWWEDCVINHNCEEVRSPIICPAEIGERILNGINNASG